KGSGMIHPDMATMLAFIATDANIPRTLLQNALSRAVDDSFNCITVDGDTSTNDACVVSATGQGELTLGDDDMSLQVFTAKLSLVCGQLAEMIILDGEGATKLARIKVSGGRNRGECKTIGYTVALSPLVKTALFGQDPNWGRILAAVGRAPVDEFDLSRVDIYLDDICIVRQGERDEWYLEEDGARVMQRDEITIHINMNQGEAEIEILTSDLSHDYVSINADYRS
ncbi:MAG: bifunctional ornithine acetyltransferase/N-acetylglutamate synthase, partial [Gammaproteobacteria bacterium]|nr:bifunctional ornithine acetyltransferase/N-acetylglutamate synthase [Gammaproteobacteria bacterium]